MQNHLRHTFRGNDERSPDDDACTKAREVFTTAATNEEDPSSSRRFIATKGRPPLELNLWKRFYARWEIETRAYRRQMQS
jgi:hypothetical protein